MQTALSLIDLHKSYGALRALDGVTFEVGEGEVLAVLGPSGSGKSTLLAVIAGLERPERGEIRWKGESLAGVPPHRRGFGLMFQDYALFPHMNVGQNVAFGLRMSGLPEPAIRERVTEMLALVGLPDFEARQVSTLSGGEQQRVALARSLAPQPRLLMLDEPLASVDRTLRERLTGELRRLLKNLGQTALYVTHDQEEAFALADRVVLLRAGKVEQVGAPQDLYRHPASLFVARFLGLTNLLAGEIRRAGGRSVLHTAIGDLAVEAGGEGRPTVLIRPEAAQLDGRGEFRFSGEVLETSFRGSLSRAVVAVGGARLVFEFPSSVALPAPGTIVQLSFDPSEAVQVFDQAGDAAPE